MTNQNVEMDSVQPDSLAASGHISHACTEELQTLEEELQREDSWLLPVFEQVQAFCGKRANLEDIHVLRFCLQHVFLCVDILYSATVPDLSASTSTPTKLEELLTHRRTWAQLQEIKRLLDRLEPLCQLLNGAVTNILASLDPLPESHPLSTQPTESNTTPDYWPAAQEQWEQTFLFITHRLGKWQQSHTQHGSFSSQFADLTLAIPTLAEMDSSFDRLLENARAIFGEILLDFQAISTGDDEASATLLLDMLQKSDQILLLIDVLMEPLHSVIKHYTLSAEMN